MDQDNRQGGFDPQNSSGQHPQAFQLTQQQQQMLLGQQQPAYQPSAQNQLLAAQQRFSTGGAHQMLASGVLAAAQNNQQQQNQTAGQAQEGIAQGSISAEALRSGSAQAVNAHQLGMSGIANLGFEVGQHDALQLQQQQAQNLAASQYRQNPNFSLLASDPALQSQSNFQALQQAQLAQYLQQKQNQQTHQAQAASGPGQGLGGVTGAGAGGPSSSGTGQAIQSVAAQDLLLGHQQHQQAKAHQFHQGQQSQQNQSNHNQLSTQQNQAHYMHQNQAPQNQSQQTQGQAGRSSQQAATAHSQANALSQSNILSQLMGGSQQQHQNQLQQQHTGSQQWTNSGQQLYQQQAQSVGAKQFGAAGMNAHQLQQQQNSHNQQNKQTGLAGLQNLSQQPNQSQIGQQHQALAQQMANAQSQQHNAAGQNMVKSLQQNQQHPSHQNQLGVMNPLSSLTKEQQDHQALGDHATMQSFLQGQTGLNSGGLQAQNIPGASSSNPGLQSLHAQKDPMPQLHPAGSSQGFNLQQLQQQLGERQSDQAFQLQTQMAANQQAQLFGKTAGVPGIGGLNSLSLPDQQAHATMGLLGGQAQHLQPQQLQQLQQQQSSVMHMPQQQLAQNIHQQNFQMQLSGLIQQQMGGGQQQTGPPKDLAGRDNAQQKPGMGQQHLLAAMASLGNQNPQGQGQAPAIGSGAGGFQLQQPGAGTSGAPDQNLNEGISHPNPFGGNQNLDLGVQAARPGEIMPPQASGQAPGQNVLDASALQMNQSEIQQNEQNISSIPNLSKMAEFCATRGDYQQAIEYYRQLITHEPNSGASWTALGHCYLLTEDIHKAFTAYQHALYSVEDMNDPQLWYGIGILYERFESYDNAISALIGVLKMSPNFYQKSEVLYKLGTIFAKTNQIEQAIKFFQNSILTSSFSVKKKVDTLIKIGLLYEEKKDFQQAKRSYEAALSLNDKNVRVYQHLAWSNFKHGNIEAALKYVGKAEKRSKDNVYSLYIKGRCLICLDNTQEAYECLSSAAHQQPTEAAFWTSLAVLLYNLGKINESFENITQATTLKHELYEVWYNLGILYETCKQPEEALIAYDMVLSIDPKQPDAVKRIAAIKQPKYQEDMADNANVMALQMKHPAYCIPNTLTILRHYSKQDQQNVGGATPGAPQVQKPAGQLPNQAFGQPQAPGLQQLEGDKAATGSTNVHTLQEGQNQFQQFQQNRPGFPGEPAAPSINQNQELAMQAMQLQAQGFKPQDPSQSQQFQQRPNPEAMNQQQNPNQQDQLQAPAGDQNQLSDLRSQFRSPLAQLGQQPNQNLTGNDQLQQSSQAQGQQQLNQPQNLPAPLQQTTVGQQQLQQQPALGNQSLQQLPLMMQNLKDVPGNGAGGNMPSQMQENVQAQLNLPAPDAAGAGAARDLDAEAKGQSFQLPQIQQLYGGQPQANPVPGQAQAQQQPGALQPHALPNMGDKDGQTLPQFDNKLPLPNFNVPVNAAGADAAQPDKPQPSQENAQFPDLINLNQQQMATGFTPDFAQGMKPALAGQQEPGKEEAQPRQQNLAQPSSAQAPEEQQNQANTAGEGEKSKDDETEKEEDSDEEEQQVPSQAFMPFPNQMAQSAAGGMQNFQQQQQQPANQEEARAPAQQFEEAQRLNPMALGLQPGLQGRIMANVNAPGVQGLPDMGQHQLLNQGFQSQPGQQAAAPGQDPKSGDKPQLMGFQPAGGAAGLSDLAGKFTSVQQPAQSFEGQPNLALQPPFGQMNAASNDLAGQAPQAEQNKQQNGPNEENYQEAGKKEEAVNAAQQQELRAKGAPQQLPTGIVPLKSDQAAVPQNPEADKAPHIPQQVQMPQLGFNAATGQEHAALVKDGVPGKDQQPTPEQQQQLMQQKLQMAQFQQQQQMQLPKMPFVNPQALGFVSVSNDFQAAQAQRPETGPQDNGNQQQNTQGQNEAPGRAQTGAGEAQQPAAKEEEEAQQQPEHKEQDA